jgi:phage tail P2-like protein
MLKNTDTDFSALLPDSLRDDPTIKGFAAGYAVEYRRLVMDVPAVMPWERLDSHTEPVLSLMAYDVNPLLWDDAWTDEVKRGVLRNALRWRMIHGTPVCVEEFLWVIMAIETRVRSWWEYRGTPGCFRLAVYLPALGLSCLRRVQLLEIVSRAKNTRSHLEALEITASGRSAIHIGACARVTVRLRLYPQQKEAAA